MQNNVTVEDKEGIKATIVADSINWNGNRLTTYELVYPRFILGEANTHKMLSKNSASSRAIPFQSILKLLQENPAMPVFWGKNQPGMKAREELSPLQIESAKGVWIAALNSIIAHSEVLYDMEVHKQILNRLNEPWQMMKTVMTGTEYENLFWLRDHEDAQPEFHVLASCMRKAREQSSPTRLSHGQWHLPYVTDTDISIGDAIKVSASMCAQVSYRKLDDTIEKALMIYEKLIESEPMHASPIEHQGTPIDTLTEPFNPSTWQSGITHVRRDGSLWSANFQGWIQYRQTLENHTKW